MSDSKPDSSAPSPVPGLGHSASVPSAETVAAVERAITSALRPYVQTIARQMHGGRVPLEGHDVNQWAAWMARRCAWEAANAAQGMPCLHEKPQALSPEGVAARPEGCAQTPSPIKTKDRQDG